MKKFLRSNSRKKPSDSSEEDQEEEEKRTPLSGYARYTNIIYLLIGSVVVGFGAGYLLDKWLHFSFPIFKLALSLGGIILGLYLVFKELNRK